MNLKTTIQELIDTNREGDYWDFKEIYHKNKAELLHDIISLSNSLHKGKRYLIFGVKDSNEKTEIVGLNQNDSNRKKQSGFIDFLRDKTFAGGIRPEIELQTIKFDKNEVDVLIIFDNSNKPYFLTSDFSDNAGNKHKIVKANYIYTRINDTNTPINKSADLNIIEKMWKERFSLDLTPLEKMQNLLIQPDNWFKDLGNKNYSYNLDFPELNLIFSDPHEFWEPYSFFFLNEKSYLGKVEFKFHSTILFELEYMYCDEMKIEFPIPDSEHLKIDDENDNWYYYFDLSTKKGKFLIFLSNNLSNMESRGVEAPFLVFKNKKEKERFNKYIRENKKEFKKTEPYFYSILARDKMIESKKRLTMDPIFAGKVYEFYKNTWSGSI